MTSTLVPDADAGQAALFEMPGRSSKINDMPPPAVDIVGRRIQPSAAFDTYWRFAAERQSIYEARQDGRPGPWTCDPILRDHRFTNCYRAADRVSQFLIGRIAYRGAYEPQDLVFRTLLFKLFNKISTWDLLERTFGDMTWASFDVGAYNDVLTAAFAQGKRLYSAAYVVPPPDLGAARKHTNHLRLMQLMMNDSLPERLASAQTMVSAFELLRRYPAIGDFLAYQFLIDINYTTALDFSESEFVVPGPGARDGIRKCFGVAGNGIEREIISYMADTQEEHFSRLGLSFRGLRGRRLQLVDCQNLFCEVDKYARVAHPDIQGVSGRLRIKQRYKVDPHPVPAWFPPKWGINPDDPSTPRLASVRTSV
jgi:hypothetical protein